MNVRRTILSGTVAICLVAFSFSALGQAPRHAAQQHAAAAASR